MARSTLILLLLIAVPSQARTLLVGPERSYKHMRDVAMVAQDGDIILVDPGVYSADVALWKQNDLVILAPRGRAHFRADGAAEDEKGIWVVEGRNFTAENIEFSGARVADHNGAGVRIHAKGKVTLRNCYFHGNENGVLGDADEVLIDGCIFDRNGSGARLNHNLYVWGPSVTVRGCYLHHAMVGHNVKTRGENNYILANRIMDEADGTGSYAIDVPDCGRTYIIGNVIEQGPLSENYHVVSYGAESDKNEVKDLYVINNTLVNNGRPDGVFLKLRKNTDAQVTNNIFYGPGTPWVGGKVTDRHNYIEPSLDDHPRFSDPASYDYRLTTESPRAIVDRGIPPGRSSTGYDLTPKLEYVSDAHSRARPSGEALDLGAFELVVPPPPPAATRYLPAPAATGKERPAKSKVTQAKKKPRSYPARSTKTTKP